MANLEQWVSDRLHDILGLSDRYVSQFMIGVARKASSAEDFVGRLEQTGTIDIDQSVTAFAKELFEKVVTVYKLPAGCTRRVFDGFSPPRVVDPPSAGRGEAVQSAGAAGDRDGQEEPDVHAAGGQRQLRGDSGRKAEGKEEKQRQRAREQEETHPAEESQRVFERG